MYTRNPYVIDFNRFGSSELSIKNLIFFALCVKYDILRAEETFQGLNKRNNITDPES